MEATYDVAMSHERYMGAWRSVNDIQVQAGEKRFQQILDMIEEKIHGIDEIIVSYTSRAFTVQLTKK